MEGEEVEGEPLLLETLQCLMFSICEGDSSGRVGHKQEHRQMIHLNRKENLERVEGRDVK
jgi:hypothetical protein